MRIGPLTALILLVSLYASATIVSAIEEHKNVTSQPQPAHVDTKASVASSSDAPIALDKSGTSPTVIVGVQAAPNADKADCGSSQWWAGFRGWLFGWQGLLFGFVIYLLFFPGASKKIKSLLEPFGTVKLFGAEFVINRRAGEDVEESIKELRASVTKRFDEWLRVNDVAGAHLKIVQDVIGGIVDLEKTKIRATIYVADLLFADSLYQLLDYYPTAPGPHGRVFSSRYGIIGKAWRLRKSDYEPSVPTDEDELIQSWGMTSEEAPSAGHQKQSFACVVFKRTDQSGGLLGLLYLDSPQRALFGERRDDPTWLDLEKRLQTAAQKEGLLSKLETLSRSLVDRSAQIDIYHS